MGVLFSCMRCATCRKLRAFRRCSCVQQRQLVEEETMAAVVEDGEPVPVGREEEDVESALLATAGRIPDAVLASPEKSMVENELADGLAGLDVRGKANEEATAAENKEVFEFGKSGKQDGGEESGSESHFSFVMKEESPKHTQAEQSSEEVVEQHAAAHDPNLTKNLSPDHVRLFKNKVRRQIVRDDRINFHLKPSNSTIGQALTDTGPVPLSSVAEVPAVAVNLAETPDRNVARSISGELTNLIRQGLGAGDRQHPAKDSPSARSTVSSPPGRQLTPMSAIQRLNASFSPGKQSPKLQNTPRSSVSGMPAVFHPEVLKEHETGAESDGDKENVDEAKEPEPKPAQDPAKPRDHSTQSSGDEEEDEEGTDGDSVQVVLGDSNGAEDKKALKRRRKNKQNRLRKKARRH